VIPPSFLCFFQDPPPFHLHVVFLSGPYLPPPGPRLFLVRFVPAQAPQAPSSPFFSSTLTFTSDTGPFFKTWCHPFLLRIIKTRPGRPWRPPAGGLTQRDGQILAALFFVWFPFFFVKNDPFFFSPAAPPFCSRNPRGRRHPPFRMSLYFLDRLGFPANLVFEVSGTTFWVPARWRI